MSKDFETMKTLEGQLLCQTYGRYPLAVARGEGSRLFDPQGREYIDLLAGIAVTNLGHCRPELIDALAVQAGRLWHVSNLFYQEPQLDLAQALLATCGLDRAFFCNSGAEANEAAIKLARRYMRKVRGKEAYEIITLEGSFHGRTLATLTATGQEKIKDGFGPLPGGFVTVPWNDLEALEKAMNPATAAVLVEVVQGEGGVRPMGETYAQAVEQLCRSHGVLFMIDEVQTGLCRTGRFWAHQNYGLDPDVITSSKALANGLPMGAMLAKEEAAKGFGPGSHATTFGGGAIGSAVARRVVELLQSEKLDRRAAEVGGAFKEMLLALKKDFPQAITDVRGLGLMVGVELAVAGQEVWRELLDRGFVLNLTQGRVLRLVPALTIAQADLELFVKTLRLVLEKADR